jgi:hyperosmotically inducible protein
MKHAGNHLNLICTLGLLAIMVGITGCKSSGERTWIQKRADREVASAVKKELNNDPMYKYHDVVPVVYEGTVQLTGWVDTPQHRQRAAELAAYARGAREIINNIALKSTPTGQPAGSPMQGSASSPGAPPQRGQGTGSSQAPPQNP